MGRNPSEYGVFADAFLRAFGIVYCIAGAGMKQAVVSAGRSSGDVALLYQKGPEPSHGTVPLGAGSRDSSAYYDYVKFV